MAKGYWLVDVEVTDAERYGEYAAVVRPFLANLGARFLTRGGAMEVVEGTGRSQQVVLEFPSYAEALAAYRSPEYQAMIPLRLAGASGDLVIVEGL